MTSTAYTGGADFVLKDRTDEYGDPLKLEILIDAQDGYAPSRDVALVVSFRQWAALQRALDTAVDTAALPEAADLRDIIETARVAFGHDLSFLSFRYPMSADREDVMV